MGHTCLGPDQRVILAVRRTIATVALLLCSALSGSATDGYAPRAFPVPGLPSDLVDVRGVVRGPNGYIIVTWSALAVQDGTDWRILPVPAQGGFSHAAYHPLGIVACVSTPAVLLRRQDRWDRLAIDDTAMAPPITTDEGVLVAGLAGIWLVDLEGQVRSVLRLEKTGSMRVFARLGGRVLALIDGPQGLQEWRGGQMVRVAEETLPSDQLVTLVQKGESDGYLLGTKSVAPPADLAEAYTRVAESFDPNDNIKSMVQHGNWLIGRSRSGLAFHELPSGKHRYTVPIFARQLFDLPEGILAVTSTGLVVVPSPEIVRHQPAFTEGYRATLVTPQGPVIITRQGAFKINGERFDTPVERPNFALSLPNGQFIWAGAGELDWAGKKFDVPELANGLRSITQLPPDRLFVSLGNGALVINSKGERQVLDLGTISARTRLIGREELLLVMKGEAVIVSTRDFRELRRFGSEIVHLLPAGANTRLITRADTMLDIDGKVVRRGLNWPFASLLSHFSFRQKFFIFGILHDGSRTGAWLDLNTGELEPLDLPLHASPLNIIFNRENLLMVFPNEAAIVSEIKPLAPPSLAAELRSPLGPYTPGSVLPPEIAYVELQLPPARLPPWTNPVYSYRVGESPWQTAAAGSIVRIPRLQYGRTLVELRAKHATLTGATSFAIERRWPWWARWPGWLLGTALLTGSVYAFVAWRTRALQRRAEHLDRIVAQRTRELAAASGVKTEFIARIHHEIRNPMNGIVGVTSLLAHDEPDPRRRLLLETLRACTAQLRATVDDVLDFDAIERGEISLQPAPFELLALLRECQIATASGPDAIHLEIGTEPLWLEGDAGKLRQIVGNFLSNALKYGDPPGGVLELTVTPALGDRRRIRIAVASSGAPLTAEERAKLFGLFIRGERARETGAPGTGLGLSVCRKFAHAMGGETGVESGPQGNAFWVELTLPVATPGATAPLTASRTSWTHLNALAIEDEFYNRLVLSNQLAALGLSVDWADSVAAAVEQSRVATYDLLITDWHFRDGSAQEVLAHFRRSVDGGLPPTIVISAEVSAEVRQQALRAGALEFVSKPIDPAKLMLAITRALDARPTPQPEAEPIDLEPLLALGSPEELVPRFTRELREAWQEIEAADPADHSRLADLVHKLRSRVLVVRATTLSRRLSVWESELRHGEEARPEERRRTARREIEGLARRVEAAVPRPPSPGLR